MASVAISPDGNLIASGSWDGSVKLFRGSPSGWGAGFRVEHNLAKAHKGQCNNVRFGCPGLGGTGRGGEMFVASCGEVRPTHAFWFRVEGSGFRVQG